jgi:hypothetical protein
MKKNEMLDRLADGTLNRRGLLKGMSALGIGVTMMPYYFGRANAAAQALYFISLGKAMKYRNCMATTSRSVAPAPKFRFSPMKARRFRK